MMNSGKAGAGETGGALRQSGVAREVALRGFGPRLAALRLPALGLGLALLLAACQPQMTYHGYAPSDADLSQIQIGRDNRERVLELIGQPGMGGVLEGSDWFYVQSDWRHTHLQSPVETDRQVVAISFDRNDRVANIERFGQRDGEVVALSRRITDAGTRPSILRQVFRVFGQMGGMVGGLTDPDRG